MQFCLSLHKTIKSLNLEPWGLSLKQDWHTSLLWVNDSLQHGAPAAPVALFVSYVLEWQHVKNKRFPEIKSSLHRSLQTWLHPNPPAEALIDFSSFICLLCLWFLPHSFCQIYLRQYWGLSLNKYQSKSSVRTVLYHGFYSTFIHIRFWFTACRENVRWQEFYCHLFNHALVFKAFLCLAELWF